MTILRRFCISNIGYTRTTVSGIQTHCLYKVLSSLALHYLMDECQQLVTVTGRRQLCIVMCFVLRRSYVRCRRSTSLEQPLSSYPSACLDIGKVLPVTEDA